MDKYTDSKCYYVDNTNPDVQYVMVPPAEYNALIAELADLRDQVRWRKASEELPKIGEEVEICIHGVITKDIYFRQAIYSHVKLGKSEWEEWRDPSDGLLFGGHKYYWRPLPKRPEETDAGYHGRIGSEA